MALAKPYNDWVIVRPGENICRTYMDINDESPTWGLTDKEYSEGMTEYIVCCCKMTAIKEYEPTWDGQTYDDASSFCALNHTEGFSALCPYKVVCPTSPCKAPIEGVFEDNNSGCTGEFPPQNQKNLSKFQVCRKKRKKKRER